MRPLGTEEIVVEASEGAAGLGRILEVLFGFVGLPNVAIPDVCVNIRDIRTFDDSQEWVELIKGLFDQGGNLASCTFESGIDRQQQDIILQYIAERNKDLSLRGCHSLVLAHQSLQKDVFTMPFLTSLDLRRARFRDAETATMLEHLVEGGTIQNLILDDCTLGIKSQTVLLPWLGEGACPLRSLSVRRCGLQLLSSGRHCGFERLLQAVGSSQSILGSLYLGDLNLKGQEAALHTAVEYLRSSHLRRLELFVAKNQLDAEASAMVGYLLARLLTDTPLLELDTNHFDPGAETQFWEQLLEAEGKGPLRVGLRGSHCADAHIGGAHLAHLDLTGAQWDPVASQSVLSSIAGSAFLESLHLNACTWLNGDLTVRLMGVLRQGWEAGTCKLSNLSLACCPLGPTGCGAVVANLLKCRSHTLRHLDLRDVRGGAGFALLGTLLTQDSLIETLVVLETEWHPVLQTASLTKDSAVLSKTLSREIPLELPIRHALLYALSERSKQDGKVSLRVSREIVTSILAFLVRRVRRAVLVKTNKDC